MTCVKASGVIEEGSDSFPIVEEIEAKKRGFRCAVYIKLLKLTPIQKSFLSHDPAPHPDLTLFTYPLLLYPKYSTPLTIVYLFPNNKAPIITLKIPSTTIFKSSHWKLNDSIISFPHVNLFIESFIKTLSSPPNPI